MESYVDGQNVFLRKRLLKLECEEKLIYDSIENCVFVVIVDV